MAAELQLPRIRRIFSEQLAQSARTPLPQFTERQVFGQLHLPGKATAVVGMRRTGKTTFLCFPKPESAC